MHARRLSDRTLSARLLAGALVPILLLALMSIWLDF
jgi:hypothetical protein